MSSSDHQEVLRLGERVNALGADALDSPVSGGYHRAATGDIAILAGGAGAAFERALPVLTTIGREVLHTGPLGSASILKVATNYLEGVQLIATGEALMMAKTAGTDLGVAYEAIRISSGNSFTHRVPKVTTFVTHVTHSSRDAFFTFVGLAWSLPKLSRFA